MKGKETVQALLDGKFIAHIYTPEKPWRLEDDGLYWYNEKLCAWFHPTKDTTFHLLMTANFIEFEKTEMLVNARIIRTQEDFLELKYEALMHHPAEE